MRLWYYIDIPMYATRLTNWRNKHTKQELWTRSGRWDNHRMEETHLARAACCYKGKYPRIKENFSRG